MGTSRKLLTLDDCTRIASALYISSQLDSPPGDSHVLEHKAEAESYARILAKLGYRGRRLHANLRRDK